MKTVSERSYEVLPEQILQDRKKVSSRKGQTVDTGLPAKEQLEPQVREGNQLMRIKNPRSLSLGPQLCPEAWELLTPGPACTHPH